MSTSQSGNGVEIISKATAVLDALRTEGEASVPRIAECVGEPVSSVYRLISSLTDAGWVERGSQRGQYRIGSKVITLGGLVESRLDIQQISRQVLRPLRSETDGTWSLHVRRGLRAVCIEIVADLTPAHFAMRVGDSLALDLGAPSLVLVAFMPVSEREAALAQMLNSRPSGQAPFQTRNRFRSEADRARQARMAIDIEETSPGVASVAAPVLNRRGEIEAAVCLSGIDPAHARTNAVRRHAELVCQAAEAISVRLGYRDGRPHDSDIAPVLGQEAA